MINDISEIPQIDFAVVIINVDTKVSTTLALLSANRYMKNAKIVLADCSKNADELEYFKKLNSLFDFYLLKLPLKVHGKTIDFFFKNLNAKKIMLLDSDAELLTDKFFGMEYLDDDEVFGCGFFHEPHLMNNQTMRGGKFHLYQERMYIPCVILDAEKTRKAILSIGGGGRTFAAKKVYNDFPVRFVGFLLYLRFAFKFFQNHDIPLLKLFRKKYYDYLKPSMVYYDTGAEIFMYLKYKCGLNFVGLPMKYHEKYFNHYHGITRKILNRRDYNSTNLADVEQIIKNKLKTEYSFDFDEFTGGKN